MINGCQLPCSGLPHCRLSLSYPYTSYWLSVYRAIVYQRMAIGYPTISVGNPTISIGYLTISVGSLYWLSGYLY